MLYGTVTEFCNPTRVSTFSNLYDQSLADGVCFSIRKCPIMNAGQKYEFLWEDGATYKKPTALSAPLYVEALMTWVQNQLDDEKLFPQKIGQ